MNRIRELRKKQNMTQKELAKHLQIADNTLCLLSPEENKIKCHHLSILIIFEKFA
ncbi:MAG: helix-turn-helix domain-containing protein [Oscillospiraceae bacterium]|jgi:DNA-binding XRE family transcriptional regulator|nr:helix-turn-helix domain-containing protein [Oscillospiraceae bacterium]